MSSLEIAVIQEPSDASTGTTAVSAYAAPVMQHVGRSSSNSAGLGMLLCKCCDRQLAVAESSYRKSTCTYCSNAYKPLAGRWSRNRKLKVWFDAMSPEQCRDWLVASLTHSQGTKRKLDDVAYEDVSANREYVGEEELDEYVPWK